MDSSDLLLLTVPAMPGFLALSIIGALWQVLQELQDQKKQRLSD